MSDEIRFRAGLPQDAQNPVKPAREAQVVGGKLLRRTRIWLDGWLEPGGGETILLLGDLGENEELEVTIRRVYKPVIQTTCSFCRATLDTEPGAIHECAA